MSLSQQTLSILAVAAAAVAAISLLYAFVLGRRLRRFRRALSGRRVSAGPAANDEDRTAEVSLALAGLGTDVAGIRDTMARAVQHVGLVRFDAFEDMGGNLSFAAALLDAEGSGIVFSSINGRHETRIYAKPIEHGASRYNLSGEEEEAIKRALGVVRR